MSGGPRVERVETFIPITKPFASIVDKSSVGFYFSSKKGYTILVYIVW